MIMLYNKLGITSEVELSNEEERITKIKALELFDSNKINEFEVGTFKGLSNIHEFLFSDIYEFAGKIRKENIAKGNLRFVSDRLKDDYDVALNWVGIFPFSIGYVSERLRNDKEFVKKALIYVPYVVLNRIAELNICNMEDVVIKEKSFLEMMNDILEVQ